MREGFWERVRKANERRQLIEERENLEEHLRDVSGSDLETRGSWEILSDNGKGVRVYRTAKGVFRLEEENGLIKKLTRVADIKGVVKFWKE